MFDNENKNLKSNQIFKGEQIFSFTQSYLSLQLRWITQTSALIIFDIMLNLIQSFLWCYSTHRAIRKVCLTTVGIEPATFGIPTVVRQTFQLARCGCTLRVTSQTSYSPEYITLRNKKCHSIIVS